MMRNQSDLVSVIIPCYNGAPWVGEAIESVLNQTYRELEVIVVDDGSTDESAEVIQLFRDPRVRYIYQENRGLSAARNAGFAASEGAYVSFLDADDVYLPEKTMDQVLFLRSHTYAHMVTGDFIHADENLRTLYLRRSTNGIWRYETVFVANRIPVHSWLARREVLELTGGFDEDLPGAEDWDFLCRTLLAKKVIMHNGGLVCTYRQVPGSMSTKVKRQTEATLKVVEKTFDHTDMPIALMRLRNEALAHTYLYGARRAFEANDRGLLKKYIGEARQALQSIEKRSRSELLQIFVYITRGMESDDFRWRLETLLDVLPEEDTDYNRERRRGWFFYRREQVMAALEGKRRGDLALRLAILAARHPLSTAGVAVARVTRASKLQSGAS